MPKSSHQIVRLPQNCHDTSTSDEKYEQRYKDVKFHGIRPRRPNYFWPCFSTENYWEWKIENCNDKECAKPQPIVNQSVALTALVKADLLL